VTCPRCRARAIPREYVDCDVIVARRAIRDCGAPEAHVASIFVRARLRDRDYVVIFLLIHREFVNSISDTATHEKTSALSSPAA